MGILERIGELFFRLIVLIIGSVIIGGIMRDKHTSTTHLYVIGVILVFILFLGGLLLFKLDKKSKRKE